MALNVLFGFSAFSQQPNTPRNAWHLEKESGQINHLKFGEDRPTIDTIGNLQPCDSLLYVWSWNPDYGSSGFLTGHNSYLDSAKSEQYTGVPGSQINGLWMFFGVATYSSTTQKIHVKVWDATGAGNSPGAELGNVDVTHSSIAADIAAGNFTTVYFTTPISMPAGGNFYAGFNMDYKKVSGIMVYDSARTVAVYNPDLTDDCADSASNFAWELVHKSSNPLLGDGKWHSYWEVYNFGSRNGIFPIVQNNACIVTITPSSASVCKGKSAGLTATVSGGSGTWTWAPATGLNVTTGATVTANPNSTTTYTATNSAGCSGTVKVTVNPKPTTTITKSACSFGKITLSANANPNTGVKYKWYLNNSAIAGATNSTYIASVSGSYKVKVTITATGCAKTSAVVNVVITCKLGGVSTAAFDASAFPNPFTKSVSVNIATGSSEAATVTLLDFSGRTLHTYTKVDASVPFEINEELTAGVYFVKVAQGLNEKMIKVVKSE